MTDLLRSSQSEERWIKGSPRAGLVDETADQDVLRAARKGLRDFCDAQGKVSIRLIASIITAHRH